MTDRLQGTDVHELKNSFERIHGYWSNDLQRLLTQDPSFFEKYLKLSASAYSKTALDPRMRELVLLAANATATQLYEPAVKIHLSAALAAGATRDEVLEVAQLISVIGIHTCNVGVPILMAQARALGLATDHYELDERAQALKQNFIAKRGYWSEDWTDLLFLDPDFFEAYTDFSAHPWARGTLSPKEKEFIYIAIDSSATHLMEPGIEAHVENALKLGATVPEILQIFELVSYVGIHAFSLILPHLE